MYRSRPHPSFVKLPKKPGCIFPLILLVLTIFCFFNSAGLGLMAILVDLIIIIAISKL